MPTDIPVDRGPLLQYPFRLDEGTFVYLKLPAPLTARDVRRIHAFLLTLVLPEDDAHAD